MKSSNNGCLCATECMTLVKPEKIPAGCPGKTSQHVMEQALDEYRTEGALAREVWQAFTRLVGHGGAKRSRLEHIMEFSSSIGYRKIGLAGCARYLPLMKAVKKVLAGYGFESMYCSCKVGGNHFSDLDLDKDSDWTLCNPLGQAMLLNDWGAELNVQFGLCMGHDLIFNHYSKAPVTVLVVKEKISDDCTAQTLRKIAKGEHALDPFFP